LSAIGPRPSKVNGLGDGDRQGTGVARQVADHRRGAGAGAAAHAGGDEHHVGAFDHLDQLVGALDRRLVRGFRVGSGAERLAARVRGDQLQPHPGLRGP
jgi:hypothetical protein